MQLSGSMLMILFYFALLPWANGQSTSTSQNVTSPISSPTIALQAPGNLTSCQTTNIAWLASNFAGTRIPFTVSYTNQGAGENVSSVISGVAVVVTDPSVQVAVWRVNITKSGRYILTGSGSGINILSSDPFTVAVSNTSCFNSTTSTPTPTLAPSITTTSSSASTLLVASPTSLLGTDPSVVPVGGNNNGSKVASMVGAIFGSVIFVALLAALAFYRRHRSLKAHTHANSKPEKPKGNRKFGGLPSVDSTVLDGIHTVTHSRPNYANSRSESVKSVKSVNNFGDTFEKGKPVVHEEERPADEVPTPFPRSRNQYSNGTLSVAQQDSGLAAFNNERARTASSDAASPATSLVEDPFLDNSPRIRNIRSQSFSVPSPVQGSPPSSFPTQSSPLTQDALGGPRISENGGPESAMRRSKSATTRPARKPVPRYDPPIEMTTTTPVYSHQSAKNSVSNVTSDSHTMLGSSVESTTPWLIERAPSVNRNIGLAFQGDGPVHYLMPDMPPSSRN